MPLSGELYGPRCNVQRTTSPACASLTIGRCAATRNTQWIPYRVPSCRHDTNSPCKTIRRQSAQVDDTRGAALQEALTQSMLECMALHAEAETRASEVIGKTWLLAAALMLAVHAGFSMWQ